MGSAKRPAAKRLKPAAAIMAALSVERARLGKKVAMLIFWASRSKVARSSLLAATPPETRTERAPASWAAARVLRAKCAT